MHIGDEMENKELEILKAEIERFKTESLKTHIVKVWAESYTNSDPFCYAILEKENNKVWWMKTQAYELWKMWQSAKTPPEGFVLVPTKNVKYFSNDGENYEVHESLAEAKKEAEDAIEYFEELLADQECNPIDDGNFHQVGYGIVLAESGYSVDHVVTQEDIDRGDYSYDVGTQIMSLFLVEAQEQSHELD